MATNFDLSVIFRAIDKLSVPLAGMAGKLNAFSQKTIAMGKKVAGFGKSMMTAITLPIMALTTLGVRNYAQQEEALLRLKNAIKITGRESEISVENLSKLASELQGVTKYEDDATLSAMALVQTMSNLNEKQLKEITPRIQDFASAMDMDLSSAAQLFGKTMSTGTNYFKRYGIEIKETGNKQLMLARLTEALDKKFRGTAKESAKGLSGALAKLKNDFGDMTEVIGQVLTPVIIKISEKFNQFKKWLENLSPAQKEMIVKMLLIVAAIGPVIFIIGKMITIVGMATKAFSVLMAVLNFLIATPAGWVILAIAAAIVLAIIVIKNWTKIIKFLKAAWDKVLDTIKRMPGWIVILITAIFPFIGIPIIIIRNWDKLKSFFINLFDSIKKKSIEAWNRMKQDGQNTADTIKKLWEKSGIKKLFSDMWKDILKFSDESGFSKWLFDVWGAFKNGFFAVWDSITEAVSKLWDDIIKNPVSKWLFDWKPKEKSTVAATKGLTEIQKSELTIKLKTAKNTEAVIEAIKNANNQKINIIDNWQLKGVNQP